jgi:hypothetical protein
MASKKSRITTASRAAAHPVNKKSSLQSRPEQISARWLLWAISGTIAAAVLCAWFVLCLLFWQGSWQLLYHPASQVTHTPADAGMAFDPIAFAANEAGEPQLKGWWIPTAHGGHFSRFTVLVLHGQTGNLSDIVDNLAHTHAAGVNIFAFDYRGYGQSRFVRPSEAHWRQDADAAIAYLIATRHIDAGAIVLDGSGLGANLALEVAAAHPELAGVILESPLPTPMDSMFGDARARLVPAQLLVPDRYDLDAAAAKVRISVLWFELNTQDAHNSLNDEPIAYREIANRKTIVWLNPALNLTKDFAGALSRFLDELPR